MTAPPIYLLDGVNKSQPPKSSSLYGVSEDYHRIFDCVCLPHTSRNWCSGPDARGGWYLGRPPLPSLNSLICIQIKHPGEAEPGVGVRVMTVLGSLESHKPVTEMLDTRNVPDTPILSRSQSPDSHCECVAWHGQGSTYLKWLCLGFSLEQGLALVTGGIPGCEMNMTSLFPPHSWPLIGHTELPEPSYLLTM